MNQFLATQLSGALAQTVIDSACSEYDLVEEIALYLATISIDTAQAQELAFIGLWMGLPWPTADITIFEGIDLTFGDISDFPTYDPQKGFGDLDNQTIGGLWASLTPSDVQRIPTEKYRLILKIWAIAKANGISIHTIDVIAKVFSDDYTISLGVRIPFLFDEGDTPTIDPLHGFSDLTLTTGGDLVFGSDPDIIVSTGDITLTFNTDIGSANLYIVQNIFSRLCTSPFVICEINV